MLVIGPHISIAKGFARAARDAVSIGANTFQFFTRNPRGASVKAFVQKDIDGFQNMRAENGMGPFLAHCPYTMNLASAKEDIVELGKRMLSEDIARMESIGVEYICFHPGSHTGMGEEKGISQIVDALSEVIKEDGSVWVLLETMSGKGTEIGYKFEHLNEIIDRVDKNDRLGVCLDTCHVFAAGYDIVNDIDGVLEEFDRVIGLERLKAIHFNDSMKEFSSKKDRHSNIGEGLIGLEALVRIMNHELLREKPFFMETPGELDVHEKEIELLRSRYEE
ncbi:Endonuclease IV [Peptoclostridium litorale DSM 5388]|uniref:Probable endonuclease 4 n=1 Tax=Peptoclostridium litorale DSM 5388 TaxID=1121324 RepID=A0A069REU6_PEPLI|nr:deoxyribonuclease IV [Peptoclostridium litorale]KDR95559.1 putative endonuclease 4 [Peptoclostridium litorale DSM 5388]SIN98281.1 Endonuclease IV [Peptoclostridium litorale DSM 5388]